LSEFFALDYRGPAFEFLGPAHLGVLVALGLVNLGMLYLRGTTRATRTRVRWGLAISIWSAEAGWHIWTYATGTWTARVMLPLHLCSILTWLSGLMLILRSHRIYEFAYFLGIGGAIQYLFTPDLGMYGFPHFRFFQAFASHGLLLTAPVFMTIVERFRPTPMSLARVIAGANLYMVPIYFVNRAIGSNFLMLNGKPATPSLLDLLPPWPYYIAYMELIGLATCLLLYAPFAVADARATRLSLSRPGLD